MKLTFFLIRHINFRFLITVVALLCMIMCSCDGDRKDGGENVDSESLKRVLYVQSLYNMNPGGDIVQEISSVIDTMRDCGRDRYYFAAVNVLIDRLFADGRLAEADSLAVRMRKEAEEEADSVSLAMARRVRAQMFYKLSQPGRALPELLAARGLVINPVRSVADFGTASSIQEWLWIVARSLNDTVLMNEAGIEYAGLVSKYEETGDLKDEVRHYPVTSLAFQGQAALTDNDMGSVENLLDSASSLTVPGIPSRAYEHLYNVRSRARLAGKDYKGALEDVDTLLTTHKDFPWFYLDDLLLKAKILEAAGKCAESTRVFSEYVAVHDSLTSKTTDQRLHNLTVLYRTEIDREHERVNRFRLIGLGAASLLFLLLFGVATVHAAREKRRNRLLVERLHELDRANESVYQTQSGESTDNLTDIERLDRYMFTERPYTNPALGRKELAEFSGLSQDAVGQLIKDERGCTVRIYINLFRLEEARRLLKSSGGGSIADMAVNLGFGTARTFQRAFKERYDMSPSQYRTTVTSLKDDDTQ